MTEPEEANHTEKRTIGGGLSFGLPQAIIVALLGIAISTAIAIASS